jgi:hypothetical protein
VGLRGALALLCAAPLSIGLISVVAVGLSFLPAAWTPLHFLLGSAVLILVLYLGWWLRRIGSAHTPDLRLANFRPAAAAIGTAVAAVVVIITVVTQFGSPESFIQSEANVFHLNAVRNSIDTGQSAIFSIAQLNAGSAPFLYPAAWEDYVTLVLTTARLVAPGVSIPAATNAALIAALVLGWCLGCQAIAQVVGGRSILQAILAAVVSTSLFGFGWLPLTKADYPTVLAYALLASAVAVLLLLSRLLSDTPPLRALSRFSREGRQRRSESLRGAPLRVQPADDPETLQLFGAHPRTILLFVAVFALVGAAATQPSAALGLGGLILIACWGVFFHRLLRPARWIVVVLRILAGVMLLAATAGFGYGWLLLATSKPLPTATLSGIGTELLNLAQGTPAGIIGTTAITVLLVVGIAGAVWLRRFTALGMGLVVTAVFVLTTGGPDPALASILGFGFGFDTARLAAFWTLATMPVLFAGTGAIVTLLGLVSSGLDDLGRAAIAGSAGLALAAAIGVPQQLFSVQPQLHAFATAQVIASTSTPLSPQALAVMMQAGGIVTGGDRLIGVPDNGSSFAYALAGVPVVFSGLTFTESSAAAQLRASLFDRTQLSVTCASIHQLHAGYFLDLGTAPHPEDYPGLAHPDQSMLEPLATQGTATLYRITACPA